MRAARYLLLGCIISLAGASGVAAEDEASWAAPEVARATFTSAVADREPVDRVTSASSDERRIYFFTELRNMSGEQVAHRWEYDGQVMAEVPFHVGGPRWRVWSSKNLEPFWKGEWKVSVMKGGEVLETRSFRYGEGAVVPAKAGD